MVLSETIIGSFLDLLNNTGEVGGGSYVSGSFIDPFMQSAIKVRSDNLAVKKFIIGGRDPKLEIVPDPVNRTALTPRYRYAGGYVEEFSMVIRIYCYGKDGRKWTDPDGTEHGNDSYVRTYLEYIGNGIKRYAPADLPFIAIPEIGAVSDIEPLPEVNDYWWGMLPIRVKWSVSGSDLT